MNILALDENNIEQYSDYISADMAENIERIYFHGLIAISEDKPVGGMIWEIRNPMSEAEKESSICWLRLDDHKAAEKLFDFYKLAIDKEDVSFSTYSLPARNFANGRDALIAEGFSLELMEGDIIRTTLSEALSLPVFQKIKPGEDIRPISELSKRGFNAGLRRYVSQDIKGVCDDIEYLPRDYFDSDVSCYCEMDGMVNGVLLVHKQPSGALRIVIMSALGGDFKRILPQMMCKSLTNAKKIYKPQTEICIDRHNYAALALSEKLFPCCIGVPVYMGRRQER